MEHPPVSMLRIPPRDRTGLRVLRELTDSSLDEFIAQITRDPSAIPRIPGVHSDDMEKAVDALQSMYQVRGYSEVAAPRFIADVVEALREANDVTPEEESALRERLEKLLSIEELSVAAKALDLATEYGRLFHGARVLTDARPVFGTDPTAPPSAVVVTHTLKIDYHDGGDVNEIYFAIGSEDIQDLRAILERADAKADSLRRMLEPTRVRIIDPQR